MSDRADNVLRVMVKVTLRRHLPQQLSLDLLRGTHGGFRPNAGRKRDPRRREPDHATRPAHVARHPLHATLRTRTTIPRLRTARVATAIRDAIARVHHNIAGFHVVHLSIQHNHLHFLIEATDSTSRTRGMQSLAIALAKAINRASARRGAVFAFRYHAVALTSPRQVRHTLGYVLGNWRHHREDTRCAAARRALFDPYATAAQFDGWSRPFDGSPHVAFTVDPPTRWLLTRGWRKAGAALDPWTVGRDT